MADLALPPAVDGRPLVAVPAGTDLDGFATAWFPQAAWDRRPVRETDTAGIPRLTGARFRGMAAAPPTSPGVLRLDAGTVLEGPHPLDPPAARALGLPSRPFDVYALVPDADVQPVTAAWLDAVARRTGGAVTAGGEAPWRVPDPGALVDLTLWTGSAVAADELVPLVRPALAGTRLGPVQRVAGRGERAFTVSAESNYDGSLVLTSGRSEQVPAVLAGVAWGPDGPWSYGVSWVPEEPLELGYEDPSRLHVIARSRMTSSVARVTATLWRVVGGTVVDAAGFVVTPDELTTRSSTTSR